MNRPPNGEAAGDNGRLARLYRISQTFNSSLDLDQVLNSVIDEVIAATRAERGFLMLSEGNRDLVFRAARGLDQNTIERPEFQVSRSVIDRVAREGQPLLTSNAQSEDWLSERRSVVALGLRSVLCVPLQHKGETRGVIYVDNRVQTGIFTLADLEYLTSIAASAAIAIENARLYQVAVEKGRLEREIQLALEVQSSLLPRQTPTLKGWEFGALWRPAREVAGDFYDFIPVDSEQLALVIADVTDKGVPAALYMALTRSIVRASMLHVSTPAEIIAHANRLICNDAAYGMFVTLFYAQLDPRTGEMTYVNAGHNPPLLYRTAADQVVRLTRTGMALGIEEQASYAHETVALNPGDLVCFYTDGLTEAYNPQQEAYGMARLEAAVRAGSRSPVVELTRQVQASVEQFVGGELLADDITLVVLKRQ